MGLISWDDENKRWNQNPFWSKTWLYSRWKNISFGVFTQIHKKVIYARGLTNSQHDESNQSWNRRRSLQSFQITAHMDLVHKKSIRLESYFLSWCELPIGGDLCSLFLHRFSSGNWVACTSGTADGTSQPVSRAHSLRSMLPRCHSGHCEAEFISRIRLAVGSRIVHWSVKVSCIISSPRSSALQPVWLAAEVWILTRQQGEQ